MKPDRKSQTSPSPIGQGDRPMPRPTASIVSFRQSVARRFRRDGEEEGATRGEILLFTGVRYERMPEPVVPAPRQRRRS